MRVVRAIGRLVTWSLIALGGVLLVGNVLFATSRDVAYRSGDPLSPVCSAQTPPSAALAEHGNDEPRLIEETPASEHWSERLGCALQTHAVGGAPGTTNSPILHYNLAFLEFKEDGSPQSMVRYQEGDGTSPRTFSQLKVLREHLRRQKANYVLVFVHGWRHDASIGDGNVADTRVYAANAARFIADRCAAFRATGATPPMPYCDTTVTAVYVGWRGARVDEKKLTRWFGGTGTILGQIAMMPTLFDRKPVSEQIGPALVTALHAIDDDLKQTPGSRMIVFGHSLGGNMLMTAMEDGLVKAVVRHDPGTIMEPPFGKLIVLINPASEAGHWTAIQRAVWQRIAYRPSDVNAHDNLDDGHAFFARTQKPIVVSVTAAHTFPPGGIRAEDCFVMREKPELAKLLEESRSLVDKGVEYDWATYDLFPAFKGDLRPVAGTLARWAARLAGDADPDDACSNRKGTPWIRTAVTPISWLADLMQNAPFMSTDREQTRTIGNLDPPRAAYGTLPQYYLPAKLIGTTHELIGHDPAGTEKPSNYATIGGPDHPACPIATGWLLRARNAEYARPNGTDWRSDKLAAGDAAEPAATFIHGFKNGGMAPITRANDPFWNMRAFDNTLARHDGYLLTSFICAMNQLVMDDVVP